jgi:hypothetical protein
MAELSGGHEGDARSEVPRDVGGVDVAVAAIRADMLNCAGAA